MRDWAHLVGAEDVPFGAGTAGLQWRPKDVHVGVRDGDGALLAAVGATLATVEVEGHEPFPVIGAGALIVRRELRGTGLGMMVIKRMTEVFPELGPDRAMLFCEPGLRGLYRSLGYQEVPGPVWADQPEGPVQLELLAMWRAIRPAEWPPGVVRLDGFPF